MIRAAYTKPETISYNFYQLLIHKKNIEYYTEGKFQVNENILKEIEADTTKYGRIGNSIYGDNTRIVAKNSLLYNHLIQEIHQYINRLAFSYRFQFAKPIFLRNYKYCVLIYSRGDYGFVGDGVIQIFEKNHNQWRLYKTLIKRFSTKDGWTD